VGIGLRAHGAAPGEPRGPRERAGRGRTGDRGEGAQGRRRGGPHWGTSARARGGAAGRAALGHLGDGARAGRPRGGHVGEREGEGGREERGEEDHLRIRRSAATGHRITPRAREVEEREREVAAREKKMRERGGVHAHGG
jgi:hypothetical protein